MFTDVYGKNPWVSIWNVLRNQTCSPPFQGWLGPQDLWWPSKTLTSPTCGLSARGWEVTAAKRRVWQLGEDGRFRFNQNNWEYSSPLRFLCRYLMIFVSSSSVYKVVYMLSLTHMMPNILGTITWSAHVEDRHEVFATDIQPGCIRQSLPCRSAFWDHNHDQFH